MRDPDPSRDVPGSVLRGLVLRLFDPQAAERCLLPAVADLQHESEANAERPALQRLTVSCRCYLAFWKTFAVCLFTGGSPGSQTQARSLAWNAALFLCITTALLMRMPFSRVQSHASGWDGAMLAVLLVPQALAMTIPISVLWVGLVGWRRSDARPSGVVRSTAGQLLAYSVGAAILSWLVVTWGVPTANQRSRELVQRITYERMGIATASVPPPLMGAPEMTAAELRRGISGSATPAATRARYAYYLHLKMALPAAALAFGLISFTWARLRHPRRWPRLEGTLTFGLLLFLYYLAFDWCRALAIGHVVPAWFAAWAPPLLFMASAGLMAIAASALTPSRS